MVFMKLCVGAVGECFEFYRFQVVLGDSEVLIRRGECSSEAPFPQALRFLCSHTNASPGSL